MAQESFPSYQRKQLISVLYRYCGQLPHSAILALLESTKLLNCRSSGGKLTLCGRKLALRGRKFALRGRKLALRGRKLALRGRKLALRGRNAYLEIVDYLVVLCLLNAKPNNFRAAQYDLL
jgi:hypothetical protein